MPQPVVMKASVSGRQIFYSSAAMKTDIHALLIKHEIWSVSLIKRLEACRFVGVSWIQEEELSWGIFQVWKNFAANFPGELSPARFKQKYYYCYYICTQGAFIEDAVVRVVSIQTVFLQYIQNVQDLKKYVFNRILRSRWGEEMEKWWRKVSGQNRTHSDCRGGGFKPKTKLQGNTAGLFIGEVSSLVLKFLHFNTFSHQWTKSNWFFKNPCCQISSGSDQ